MAASQQRLDIAIAVLGLAYIASQTAIGMLLHPVGTGLAFKFQLATDKDTALQVLNLWGEAGRIQFAKHFRLDFIHPLLYSGLLFVLLKRFCQSWLGPRLWPLAAIAPWIAAACDEVENLMELRILHELDAVPAGVVLASGMIASCKWLLAAVCLLLALAGILRSALGAGQRAS